MKLDLVHDLQRAYRKTLDSMSRPGVINNFRAQADKMDMEIACFDATLVLVLILFNTEVKFYVCSKFEAEMAKLINQLTYAKKTEVQNADYILVLKDAQPEELERAIRLAYPGVLIFTACTMVSRIFLAVVIPLRSGFSNFMSAR